MLCTSDARISDGRPAPGADPRQGDGRRAAQRRRRSRPLPHRRHSRRGLDGELRPRAHARRQDVFQRQPPHQSHERLRGGVPPVRLRPQERFARRLHHGARRSVRDRGFWIHRGGHRISHRRRTASRPAVSIFPRSLLRPEAALSAGASQSLHHGRGRVSVEARQAFDSRDAGATEGLGRGFAARRRR